MPHSTDADQTTDTGLASLALVARFHGFAADTQHLSYLHGKPGQYFDTDDIVLAARSLGLKARQVESSWERLAKTTFPVIAQHSDGHFIIVAGCKDEKVLVQDPLEKRALSLPREVFEKSWNCKLILFTRRNKLSHAM